MFGGIQFSLGHFGVMPMLPLWDVHYRGSLVMLSKYFGRLQSFGHHWKETVAGLGLLLIYVLSLAWTSSSSQSDDIANSSGQVVPSGVQIAQYFE